MEKAQDKPGTEAIGIAEITTIASDASTAACNSTKRSE